MTPLRVLAIADSDSYVKWGAALVERMPESWDRRLVVLASPLQPSAEQLAAAVVGTRWEGAPPPIVRLEEFARLVAETTPDVVLLSTRGPIVKVVLRVAVAASEGAGRRPVFVGGLPGISIPATRKAIAYRAQTDLVVLHSRREIRDFGRLAERMRIPQRFALASLPFVAAAAAPSSSPDAPSPDAPSLRAGVSLESREKLRGPRENRRPAGWGAGSGAGPGAGEGAGPGAGELGPIVFAAQAKVPFEREERLALLGWLAEAARREPGRRVIIKVRAAAGEAQTHPERYDYRELLGELSPPAPPNLLVEGGSMADHLAAASGLVTLSSTAAIEAVGRGVPVITLSDFGVGHSLINIVFEGSGLSADHRELIAGRFRHPEPAWLDDNYFHPAAAEDLHDQLEHLVAERERDALPLKPQPRGTRGGRLRLAWDRRRALGSLDRSLEGRLALVVGWPAMHALRLWRRARRGMPGRLGRLRAYWEEPALPDPADSAPTADPIPPGTPAQMKENLRPTG